MEIKEPDKRITVMISPKELAEKLEIKGEIVSLFMRKGYGKDNRDEQPRIEMKVILP